MADPTLQQQVNALDTAIEDQLIAMFHKMRKAGHEIQLMAHIVGTGPDGKPAHALVLDGVSNPVGDKDAFVEQVRTQAAALNAVWVAVMAEWWAVILPMDANPNDVGPPSEHPNRVETLNLIVEGPYTHSKKSRIGDAAPSVVAAKWFFNQLAKDAGSNLDACEIFHDGTCCRCGRALTVPESVASGIGPICAEKGL